MWCNSSASSVMPKKPWQPWPAQQLPALLATASLAHSCPEDLWLLPACTYFGTGKRNSQEERTLSEAGVGDLLDLLPGSASVCDPSVSALRERMRFSLRCACLIFTTSMDVSAQVSKVLLIVNAELVNPASGAWRVIQLSNGRCTEPFYIPYHIPSDFQTALQKGHGSPVRPTSCLQWCMVLTYPLKWH